MEPRYYYLIRGKLTTGEVDPTSPAVVIHASSEERALAAAQHMSAEARYSDGRYWNLGAGHLLHVTTFERDPTGYGSAFGSPYEFI